jgi:hypothetical protein
MEMARIGATAKGGSNRQTLTDLDSEGRHLLRRWAEAAGCTWEVRDPVTLIRKDWREALSPGTWTRSYWSLNVGVDRDLGRLRPLLLRLRPTVLIAPACKDANLDAVQGLTGLHHFDLSLNSIPKQRT